MNLLVKELNWTIWIPVLIACMTLSSCRSLEAAKPDTAKPSSHIEREKSGKFSIALKDRRYVLRLVRSSPMISSYQYFNPRYLSREFSSQSYKNSDYQKALSKHRLYVSFHYLAVVSEYSEFDKSGLGDWYTFQMCDYSDRVDLRCWFPLLNRSKYPVPINADFISLNNLTAADGTDLILGEVLGLWRGGPVDLTNLPYTYKEVESVWQVISNVVIFQKKLWNVNNYTSKITKLASANSVHDSYKHKLNRILDTEIGYKCSAVDGMTLESTVESPVVCNSTGK